ncbi:hypothetical protein PN499_25570 [Kamptonema animale CS-326]|jgi:hypothetical protein|uniref:hypothetical protein n=1 Tax=Kamptonema animale TaxID=92934 RepID=UPI00232E19CB|nr:hypothetical protein [Kamptonema animale]MDB9514574.1 hypothetical protein [Kamptonema animale CS-326]
MFAKFHALYPTGQLISELVTIYHGKFVVRTLIQVDGKTLATAMSAGDSVELAEDQSWKRSLSMLDLNTPMSQSTSLETEPVVRLYTGNNRDDVREDVMSTFPGEVVPQVPQRDLPVTTEKVIPSSQSSFVNTKTPINDSTSSSPPEPVRSPLPPQAPSVPPAPKQLDSDAWLSSSYGVSSQSQEIASIPSPTGGKTETSFSPPTDSSLNIGEVEPLSTDIQSGIPLEMSPPSETIEDNSDTIAQIDVLLKRLKWSKEQESEYLLEAYGKFSQGILPRHELLDFLDYLEIFSKTTEEITRLRWDKKKGRDHLNQAYGKIARHQLNKEQLLDFLQYLESQ